jgi:hypothetical protein
MKEGPFTVSSKPFFFKKSSSTLECCLIWYARDPAFYICILFDYFVFIDCILLFSFLNKPNPIHKR